MTTFRSHQSGHGRGVGQKAGTITFQIRVTNCARNLRCYVHEARKIVCNNFQRAAQERIIEWSFYARDAVPLVKTRFLRLAQISPMAARIPARQPRDDRTTTGKIAGKMSCGIAAQLPGNSRATATAKPPDGRADDSQDNLQHRRATAVPQSARWPRQHLAR